MTVFDTFLKTVSLEWRLKDSFCVGMTTVWSLIIPQITRELDWKQNIDDHIKRLKTPS